MIEIIIFDPAMRRLDTATAATAEDALYAGRVLYDEATDGRLTGHHHVGFFVDGKLAQLTEGRPS